MHICLFIRSLQSEPNIFLTWGFKDQEDVAYSPSRLAWSADFNCSCFYRSNSSAELLHFVAKVINIFLNTFKKNIPKYFVTTAWLIYQRTLGNGKIVSGSSCRISEYRGFNKQSND